MGQVISKLQQINDVPTYPGAIKYLRVAADGTLSWEDAGVSDHGALTGLGDDDHTQYLLKAGGTLTGAVLLPTGNAAACSVAWDGYAGLGFYRYATNGMAFAAAGAAKVLYSTGAVAIQGGVNLTLSGGELSITEDAPANVPLTVKGASSQSANLQEWTDSAGTVLASVSAAGRLDITDYLGFVGDVDTYIHRNGSNIIDLYCGGSRSIRGNSAGALLYGQSGSVVVKTDATGLGFYGTTPVAQAAPADHVAAIAALDTVGLTAGSPALSATQLLLPDGSAGAPGWAFANSTNSGAYWASASSAIRFAVGGADKFYIKSNLVAKASLTLAAGNNLTIAGGELTITEDAPANKPLTVKGASSQSENLQEWQDSVGAVKLSVLSSGKLKLNETTGGGRSLLMSEQLFLWSGSHSAQFKSNNSSNWRFLNGGSAVIFECGGNPATIGFYGTTPTVQASHVVDADGTLADITTKFNQVLANLEAIGIHASS